MPIIIFIISCTLAFAIGTSWGTFGIIIPIVVSILSGELMIITISACLSGATCGDHCSPISDTTIISSVGSHCDHIVHVSTQLPYALVVAGVSLVSFAFAPFIQNAFVSLGISIALMILTLVGIKRFGRFSEVKTF